jgi:purine-binding chemotaxis protein CheW
MLDYVKEVLKDTPITNVPGTPEFIEGIMNLRGDYITVLNLRKFLGMSKQVQANDKKPVIIVSCNDMELAFLIDKINELFEIQEDKIMGSSESYFASEFIYNKMPYTILNIEKIFTDKRIIVTDM